MSTISITLDLEWSTTPVLEDTLELLSSYDIDVTLFSTHDDDLDVCKHERALHPNFLNDGASEGEILTQLTELYPDAEGIRSHSLYMHSKLRDQYERFGITYESNYLMYLVEGLNPFTMISGTIQFPIYFMDDNWFQSRTDPETLLDIKKLVSGPGLRVFDFHPPHVCFNTPTEEHYEEYKDDYWDSNADINALRSETLGVRDLFIGLLDHIESSGIETKTLGELTAEHQDERYQ